MKIRSNPIQVAAFAAIEMLEQRWLLSSTVQAFTTDNGDGTQTLEVVGTKNKDSIDVYDDPSHEEIVVKDNKTNTIFTFDYDRDLYINVVHIDAKQGDDTVRYELVSDYDSDQRSIEADLSDGNDKFTFVSPTDENDSQGSDTVQSGGANITDGSDINMEIEGQEKNDTIDIDFSNTSIIESKVLVNVDAGTGNDKVSFESPLFENEEEIGDFALAAPTVKAAGRPVNFDVTELQLQIDLGSGTNTYTQDLESGIFNADVTVNVNGGSGADKIQDTENYGLVDGSTYKFSANLGAGNDYYNGEFAFGEDGLVIDEGNSATYNIQGGDGNDRITAEGEDQDLPIGNAISPAGVNQINEDNVDGDFTFLAYGGNGNDTLDMFTDTDHALFIGTGEDSSIRVVLSGDYGNDKVLLFLGATEDSEGDYDLSVLGGAGKDTVGAGFDDESVSVVQNVAKPNATVLPAGPSIPIIESNITFGPAGAILLDGGRDSDQYDTEQVTINGFPTVPFDIRAVEKLNESILPEIGD